MDDKNIDSKTNKKNDSISSELKPLLGHFFTHRKTGKKVKVVNEPLGHWDYVELLHLETGRKSRKQKHYFDYDYIPQIVP